MSHYIGTGTVNISINVPIDERAVLENAAVRKGMFTGAFVKKLILLGLAVDDPASAEKLREARRKYYGATMLLILGFALLSGQSLEMRRAARRTRVEERMEETV